MNAENRILLVVILGTIVILGFGIHSYVSRDIATVSNVQESILSGTTETGDVAIQLTPLGIIDDTLQVEASFNTHSVDLTQFDLKTQTRLYVGKKEVSPSSVPQLQGHHASGTFTFPLSSTPQEFMITITGIPTEEVRRFRW